MSFVFLFGCTQPAPVFCLALKNDFYECAILTFLGCILQQNSGGKYNKPFYYISLVNFTVGLSNFYILQCLGEIKRLNRQILFLQFISCQDALTPMEAHSCVQNLVFWVVVKVYRDFKSSQHFSFYLFPLSSFCVPHFTPISRLYHGVHRTACLRIHYIVVLLSIYDEAAIA